MLPIQCRPNIHCANSPGCFALHWAAWSSWGSQCLDLTGCFPNLFRVVFVRSQEMLAVNLFLAVKSRKLQSVGVRVLYFSPPNCASSNLHEHFRAATLALSC